MKAFSLFFFSYYFIQYFVIIKTYDPKNLKAKFLKLNAFVKASHALKQLLLA